jgi:hypothetical protein
LLFGRYRVIIRKTLVYSLVTGMLALVYFGGVLLRQIFTGLGAGQSPAALVLSTWLKKPEKKPPNIP